MTRKHRSEEEKARTDLSDMLAAHPQTPKSLAQAVDAVMFYHKIDHRTAVCALRDYFQVEVSKHMDLMAKGLDDDMKRLRSELEAKLR